MFSIKKTPNDTNIKQTRLITITSHHIKILDAILYKQSNIENTLKGD